MNLRPIRRNLEKKTKVCDERRHIRSMFVVEKCFLENVEKRHLLTMDEQMMDHQVDDTMEFELFYHRVLRCEDSY